MLLRIVPRTKYYALIELDDICWGTLPFRVLLPLYPSEFWGEISSDEGDVLLQLLHKQAFCLLTDYLAKGEHSEMQCKTLLMRRKFHPAIIAETIARCIELEYLDNARFAELLIRSYISRRASKRAIIEKLREQLISASIWEPLLNELYDKEEAAYSLSILLEKYCSRNRELPYPKLKEKAFTYLYRKGFELDNIRIAWEGLNSGED